MHPVDWGIVIVFCAASLIIGLAVSRRAGSSLESYFVSNRALGWFLAGTSIAATAFSSDTPLLITGMVRRRGVWGVWEVWALGISTMLTVFVFSKLWKRANVMTEVELVELRYSGRAAAFLRGFKAVYWGLLYNCFLMGALVITGMTKALQEITGASREHAIIWSVILGTFYTSMAGLWGVVLTDAFQFIWAIVGAVILAVYAVNAVGGLGTLVDRLEATPYLDSIPTASTSAGPFLESPLGWFLGLLVIQWWAWKNTDGGGVIVQRLVSCKDERQAMLSVLWFNIAHYCLRSWPWVLTALASIALIPDESLVSAVNGASFIDHERAYPRLIMLLLPVGLRGILVAAFFAAFLSTISTQLNWGGSYLTSDLYKRFLNRRASERHYLLVARIIPFVLALGAMGIAFFDLTIGASFTFILNLTAGIGPVYLLRWFWWRINSWSEISAMVASLLVKAQLSQLLGWLGLPSGLFVELSVMVIGTALVWLPVTLFTPPVDRGVLKRFYAKVRPPGWWRAVARSPGTAESWRASLIQWAVATVALLATTIGPLELLLQNPLAGWLTCGIAMIAWVIVVRNLRGTSDRTAR